MRLVLRRGVTLTAIGIAVGIVGALATGHTLSSLLFGVRATDPITLVGAAALLATVSVLACYGPARRATKADPLVALRTD